MTKTTFRFFFHFSFLFLKFHNFTPTALLANLRTDEFFHFFNVNASIQPVSDLLCCFFFSWSMSGGTEPKLEPMLDFNTSAKTLKVVSPTSFY